MAKRRTTTERERSDRFMHNVAIAEVYNERAVSRDNIRYYRKLVNHPAVSVNHRIAIFDLLVAEYERYRHACNLCTLGYIGVRKGSWEYHILNDRRKYHTVSTFSEVNQ